MYVCMNTVYMYTCKYLLWILTSWFVLVLIYIYILSCIRVFQMSKKKLCKGKILINEILKLGPFLHPLLYIYPKQLS
jgi:hypothetical protein